MNNKPLYIFVHIPKTAGLTFRYHIRKNFSEEKYLLLAHTLFGLKSYPPPDYQEYKEKVFKYLSNLDNKRKNRLTILFGHYVPHGVHKYFDRPYKYITFVRNPIKRVVSAYNHKLTKYHLARKQEKDTFYVERSLFVKKRIPNFEEWFDYYYSTSRKYSTKTMYEFLKNLGYGNEIEEMIEKFYFIGITKKFQNDFLYLCKKLGINKHFLSKNKSIKFFKLKDNKIKQKIATENIMDIDLYTQALEFNKLFKKEHPTYDDFTSINKIKRILVLPISQLFLAPKDTFKLLKNFIISRTEIITSLNSSQK